MKTINELHGLYDVINDTNMVIKKLNQFSLKKRKMLYYASVSFHMHISRHLY